MPPSRPAGFRTGNAALAILAGICIALTIIGFNLAARLQEKNTV